MPLVSLVRGLGGHLALELPRHCMYWSQPLLTQFVTNFGLLSAEFDGCMYGLVAKHGDDAGQLLLKPWKLVTTSTRLASSITERCTHNVSHVRIEKRNTKSSETYPHKLAKEVLKAIRIECKRHVVGVHRVIKHPTSPLGSVSNLSPPAVRHTARLALTGMAGLLGATRGATAGSSTQQPLTPPTSTSTKRRWNGHGTSSPGHVAPPGPPSEGTATLFSPLAASAGARPPPPPVPLTTYTTTTTTKQHKITEQSITDTRYDMLVAGFPDDGSQPGTFDMGPGGGQRRMGSHNHQP
jgi:hypothetical protein